jgi:hypothetical protein
MTRKDYINIAAAILATQTRIRSHLMGEEERNQQLRGVRRAAAHLADFLKDDNPRGFNPALFLQNCGYGAPGQDDELQQLTPNIDEVWSRRAWRDREETERAPRPVGDVEGMHC